MKSEKKPLTPAERAALDRLKRAHNVPYGSACRVRLTSAAFRLMQKRKSA